MDISTLRHSASHVLAHAVKILFPKVKLGIGPAIDNGFYYDFDNIELTPDNLKKIEEKMHEIIKNDIPFKKQIVTKEKAKKLFKDQPYKLELLKDMKGKITIYQQGDFIDLCAGPHINSTGQIKAFKLLNIAGAYWKGSEKNKMLQRIYGTAFPTQKELDDFLKLKEEAEKRDHIKIGKELEIFSVHQDVGAGLVHWHPNGAIIRNIIEDFWKQEHKKRGYLYVYTPHIGNIGLWKKSGHLTFYKESMYSPMKIDKNEYLIKPMNCPFHIQIYQTKLRSYKELPIRYCELGTVYRYERAGTLHGLTRVRGFTQDDSHIFCILSQLQNEIENVLDLALYMMSTFGFKDIKIYLSTRDKENKSKYLGDDKSWKNAEYSLEKALQNKRLKYQIEQGEAVFYGPKIDIKLIDSLKREWQGPTIQVDFNFPEKFDITYEGEDSKKHRVILIHRTVLGSMERFIGCLIENYAGKFPTWLSPTQIILMTVTDRNIEFAKNLKKEFEENNLRVQLDDKSETISKKVRDAQLSKVPYMITIGDKEQQTNKLAIRTRNGQIQIKDKNDFLKEIIQEIKDKK
ncbi:MAG: threonine--tRNA ligase [Candidatus Woesearchaeota archaeon]